MQQNQRLSFLSPLQRIRLWYGLLLLVAGLFIVRAFYLQVIRHDYYQTTAFRNQLKQYEIPAERGTISAHDGTTVVPLVLNETLYTLTADPTYVKNPAKTAAAIQKVLGGNVDDLEKQLKTPKTRYVVLAKRLSKNQKQQIEKLSLKGIILVDTPYRTYPDGSLAAQLLGFVNQDGAGRYGIEQALDDVLKGTVGQLKAITDSQGVPLPANKDNRIKDPKSGNKVVLTIDLGVQQQVEEILKANVDSTKAKRGSAIVIDVRSGAVRAMANYPTYNPTEYYKGNDEVFTNAGVTQPLEVGSIMKALTVAAALDKGVVSSSTSYYDPSFYKVDDATVRNVEEDGGAGTKTVQDILRLSLNTGATWLLMQMGGGQINQQARVAWYDYMTNHYRLNKPTGIEQAYEPVGIIPDPKKGNGLNITYANTAFGQGMSASLMQMGAAFTAVVNGGTYYRPYLVDKQIDANGKEAITQPTVLNAATVKPEVSKLVTDMLITTLYENRFTYGATLVPTNYGIGGKTGTAQISKPTGGYYDDRFNGTYLGFVGGDEPQYVIAVSMIEPHVTGYAGAKAAAPVFLKIANSLINNYDVSPKN